MSFDVARLTRIAHEVGASCWSYRTDDDTRELTAPGYFGEVTRLLRRGELIFASCMEGGVRATTALLVVSMPGEPVRVQSLGGAGVADGGDGSRSSLAALTDVRLAAAQRGDILTHDGTMWVNAPLPDPTGDAHAAVIGNPHRTTAADVGAIAADEKEQPNGVASLDADGKVPLAQLPALFGGRVSTCETLDAADPRFAGGLRPANPAAANDEALAVLFAALRASTADRKYVQFPAGTFDISASIAPSGKALGCGDAVGGIATIEFKNCEFVVNGTASDYNEITLSTEDGWLPLDHFSLPPSGGPYRLGSDLFDTIGQALRKHVVFDIRNCAGLSCLGRLSLTRPGTRIPHLAAFGSSGGAGGDGSASASNGSGMQGGGVSDLRIENFAIGMFALRLNSCSETTAGTWSFADFGTLNFVSCGRGLVIEGEHGHGMNIHRLMLMGDRTSYLADVHGINIGSCVLTCDGSPPLPGELSPKLLEVSRAELQIGTLHGRSTQPRAGFSLINVCNGGLLRIGLLHHGTAAARPLQSGCLVTAVSADSGESCTAAAVHIGAARADPEKSPGLAAIVGISANSGGARRQIWAQVHDGDADGAPMPVMVVRDYGAAALGAATTNDRIYVHIANGGLTVKRLVNGELSDW